MDFTFLPEYAAKDYDVHLSSAQLAQFAQYAALLDEWNKTRANLTAITDPQAVEVRHFLDSLSVLKAFTPSEGLRVIDVGTGAGFPGVPLQIVAPQMQLTLLEATGKKIAFLQHLVQQLGLPNVHYTNARAEEAGQDAAHREQYAVVVARAVAIMPVLVEYLLPLARIGGLCIAMKGQSAAEETQRAAKALRLLGGRLVKQIPIVLPNVDETHYLVVFEKVAETPLMYPRKPGVPSKKPLTET
ncbi:MAG: 16S rRNA (guanine(527)-N(7))-methyltransferase RsmG [Anaerolineae bacterium]